MKKNLIQGVFSLLISIIGSVLANIVFYWLMELLFN